MRIEDLDARWYALSEEVMTGMAHRPTPPTTGTWARLASATSQSNLPRN
jgi:hypothetical protein